MHDLWEWTSLGTARVSIRSIDSDKVSRKVRKTRSEVGKLSSTSNISSEHSFLLLFDLALRMNRNWFWSKPEIKRMERICTASQASCAQVLLDSNDLGLGITRSDAFLVIKRDWNIRWHLFPHFLRGSRKSSRDSCGWKFSNFFHFYQPRATAWKLILINRLRGKLKIIVGTALSRRLVNFVARGRLDSVSWYQSLNTSVNCPKKNFCYEILRLFGEQTLL